MSTEDRRTFAHYLRQVETRHLWLWVVMRVGKDVINSFGVQHDDSLRLRMFNKIESGSTI